MPRLIKIKLLSKSSHESGHTSFIYLSKFAKICKFNVMKNCNSINILSINNVKLVPMELKQINGVVKIYIVDSY